MIYIVTEGCIPHEKKNHLPGDTIEGLSDADVKRLLKLGRIKPAADEAMPPADAKAAAVAQLRKDLDRTMKVEQIKTELEKMGVEIPVNAKKPELIDLLIDHTNDPPVRE